ncbi:selenium metabolism-associated LysR family transcriptional regulator [Marinisporobacter balticus]|uniref:DNA-binding transcriptional LysR family regulator n=1 Tax=Marinisporobacter balticus TaxID=2018667 RepID=A0A4R2KZJ0_9FIRM|nr:selenium metabolism-associated LysR family transcriptional regulator [Marinisporobacter balticus]TCO79353.1 DNA-binding transcriptional LysR family regulator [Marinisporobacter balticus]
MDFRQLETFVTIARLKSFSKAADSLFLTQPTISNHIQNLENELHTILLNRSNKKVTLTKGGEILFRHAIEILNRREQALFSLESFKDKIEGTLEIACSTIPEQYILPPLLSAFNKTYPNVQYNLLHYDSQQVVDGILNGTIDFGFVGAKEDIKQLNYIDVMKDHLIFIAPFTDQYKTIEKISVDFLRKEKMIIREKGSGTRKFFEQVLHFYNLSLEQLNIVAVIENTEAIKQCVKQGLGTTMISELAVKEELHYDMVKKIELKNMNPSRKFSFVYHESRILSPLAETFKNFMLENQKLL